MQRQKGVDRSDLIIVRPGNVITHSKSAFTIGDAICVFGGNVQFYKQNWEASWSCVNLYQHRVQTDKFNYVHDLLQFQ